jgi:hypothetical protein
MLQATLTIARRGSAPVRNAGHFGRDWHSNIWAREWFGPISTQVRWAAIHIRTYIHTIARGPSVN